MQVWPQDGWFVGLRRALFGHQPLKRALAAVLTLTVAVLAAEFVMRPDPRRVDEEQYDVLSAYFFRVPVAETPLPVKCAENPKYWGESRFAEIRQYYVLNRSISVFSQPSTFSHLLERKIQSPQVPVSAINNFFVRNLWPESFEDKFSGVHRERLLLVQQTPILAMAPQPAVSARVTRVGFNRDFTMAMFYAEVTCDGNTEREYVYMAKAIYRGWYWYAWRVERK